MEHHDLYLENDPSNIRYQEAQRENICLNSIGNFQTHVVEFNNFLFTELDNLMEKNEATTEIDFEFINCISAIPYRRKQYDQLTESNNFDITKNDFKTEGKSINYYKFKNNNLNYDIINHVTLGKEVAGGGSGGMLFFLKRKDKLEVKQ